jgi:hypothetical protein
MRATPIAGRKISRVATALGILIALASTGSAMAQQGTAEGRRACTPEVYRFCAGEIPNVRAIIACLQRHKGSLAPGCRAAMEQGGY